MKGLGLEDENAALKMRSPLKREEIARWRKKSDKLEAEAERLRTQVRPPQLGNDSVLAHCVMYPVLFDI